MDIQSIRTEADYGVAPKAVSKLADADPAPGTPAGDELERLSILIERYETEQFAPKNTNARMPFSRERYLKQLREGKLEPHPVVDFGEPQSNEFGGPDEQF
ncbi:hypothetical protein B7L17_011695 [Burkholderia cenocepacia]|uniref:hypothetical protein n=1 Tax=Burkholderia cenocepacia TaxID=95486 RepID=UPI0022379DDF|nr:hypothetical protein [Burkholderia cenocepacia]MCW5118622.1 hypothetical protein [Burkholderia cenocepacia]MCW5130933.1 hypothetical protein [Burkholderia cenocepacia]MCW5174035.1 hypothetical protein [Burkholderia cenocepacia]